MQFDFVTFCVRFAQAMVFVPLGDIHNTGYSQGAKLKKVRY